MRSRSCRKLPEREPGCPPATQASSTIHMDALCQVTALGAAGGARGECACLRQCVPVDRLAPHCGSWSSSDASRDTRARRRLRRQPWGHRRRTRAFWVHLREAGGDGGACRASRNARRRLSAASAPPPSGARGARGLQFRKPVQLFSVTRLQPRRSWAAPSPTPPRGLCGSPLAHATLCSQRVDRCAVLDRRWEAKNELKGACAERRGGARGDAHARLLTSAAGPLRVFCVRLRVVKGLT